MLNHNFLWSPTPAYYLFTGVVFFYFKRRYNLKWGTGLPVMILPATADYFKRDHYIKQNKKEYDEFKKSNKVVMQIMSEKTSYVTLEQVLTFVFHLSMDKEIDQRRLLPISML